MTTELSTAPAPPVVDPARTRRGRYGTVLGPPELAPSAPPAARGTLSEYLLCRLAGPRQVLAGWPAADDDALFGEDGALALYCLYELHYRGFAGVDEDWEWEPSLLALRAELEEDLEARLRRLADDVGDGPGAAAGAGVDPAGVPAALREIIGCSTGPSLSGYLAEEGSLEQFREFAIHRSLLQLKEADPHSWAIPRLSGAVKAALMEIQMDEYGNGRAPDAHQNLFGVTMLALGLDPGYGRYLDRVPATTLATVNLPTFLGLRRRMRGALVGHLAVFEMTSVEPMSAYAAALRRHGLPPGARHFFEVHVVADAHHQAVAAEALAGGLARAEPTLTDDILFGARAVMAVEGRCSAAILDAWRAGRSSLRAG
ncbi:iron-containing redox enzyme family protein [Frankia sp. CNm7]|uniref:Iron-containing redox enzyme family protein n=1 Tax=Frankia nepalensis TaxID=1836974 RepID=A0A937RAL0_9ACTN|nr:iron-containing redox enzyme family protein [Frankia nepalensis]MBL7495032.1 iron-containing redox enzyme family protein [Frankia nepalensis]MBL7511104.1 iron-containing redox enzyme family protein [Frankia nepalensis]MBL7519342.1 iron-containing redox enzyme family protein [Frankia nepalensis]MBL7626930.1 iron-containing redox enzyme family protein [Frankia nepalensis]